MLESQSKAQILAYFPMKTWVKKFHLAVGAQCQITWAKIAKHLPHLWSHPQTVFFAETFWSLKHFSHLSQLY